MSLDQATSILNAIGFITFVALLSLAVVRMALRFVLYNRAGRTSSIVLRRDFALLGALLAVFGSVAFIRFFGWNFLLEEGWPRFFYILASDIVALGALAYWVWAEYFIIGNLDRKDE
jgi:amino acid permease